MKGMPRIKFFRSMGVEEVNYKSFLTIYSMEGWQYYFQENMDWPKFGKHTVTNDVLGIEG